MFGNKTGVNLHGEIVLVLVAFNFLIVYGRKRDKHTMGSDLFQIGL